MKKQEVINDISRLISLAYPPTDTKPIALARAIVEYLENGVVKKEQWDKE